MKDNMKRVYLDWNASEPLSKAASDAMIMALKHYGNPSSVHLEGRQARSALERARDQIAELIGYQMLVRTIDFVLISPEQINKYKKLAELSNIKNGDIILEIGCGWGGFSEFLGNNYNCKITAITISKEQFNFAKKRIEEANLSKKITVLFCDYRNIEGKFDKIVSIEMFEAVGKDYWNVFFLSLIHI